MAFTIDDIDDEFELTDDFQMTTKIMVFGVGGAGGNAAEHMVDSGVRDVEYVIANTDVAALRKKDGSKMKRIQLGRKTTRGQGAGNDPSKGKASAEENRDDIASALDGVSMLFVAAGMGGGTGTGAAPVVASVAKEKGVLTVGVVTKPFDWEGDAKMQMAIGGVSEMKKYVDALIVIPNNRVRELRGSKPKVSLKEAFGEVDDVLCKAVMGMIRLLQGDGYINVDFADITATLKESGIAHIAIGKGKGDNKVEDALNEVMNSPLLETSIDGACRGLLNVSVPSSFPLDEFDGLTNQISAKFDTDAKFKCGIVFDDELADDEVSLIVVATEFAEAPSPAILTGITTPNVPVEGPTPDEFDFEPKKSSAPFADGFSDSQDIDTLLRKFNQGKDN